ncbi:MAG: DUF3833 family protein [Pseudomonadota bacterium]
METLLTALFGAALALVLVTIRVRYFGFRGQRISEFEGSTPVIDPRTHLSGPLTCEGLIYGPTGRVSSKFVADFHAKWEGNKGIMDEFFQYEGGSTQTRQWRLSIGNDGTVIGEADDIVGRAEGRMIGSALHLDYKIRLTEDAGGHVLDCTDWMYLGENGTIFNHSQFRKFGVKVAELIATIRPKAEQEQQAA